MSLMAETIHSSDTLTLKQLLESQSLLNPLSIREGAFVDMASAFLGPALWDRTLPYNDLKLQYMDVNKFLRENGIPVVSEAELMDNNHDIPAQMANQREQVSSEQATGVAAPVAFNPKETTANSYKPPNNTSNDNSTSSTSQVSTSVEVEFDPLSTDIALATVPGQHAFDPKTANFNDDELKPQPMIKKSKKVHVAAEQKDDTYWVKRKRNNCAAKRSRDARRVKENQIAIRAGYLQKESNAYKTEIQNLKKENVNLKKIIEKYETQLKLF